MNTLKTVDSHTKSFILNFIKNVVSKSLYKAFSILLSPCCKPTISSLVVTCVPGSPDTYNITITTSDIISYGGDGVAKISISGADSGSGVVSVTGTSLFSSSNTFTFTGADITALGGAGTYSVDLTLILAPNALAQFQSGGGIYGTVTSNSQQDVDFPSC